MVHTPGLSTSNNIMLPGIPEYGARVETSLHGHGSITPSNQLTDVLWTTLCLNHTLQNSDWTNTKTPNSQVGAGFTQAKQPTNWFSPTLA